MDGVIYLLRPIARVGAISGDQHGGAFEPKRWYEELKEGFINELYRYTLLDFVILNGDLFDTKISINSDAAKFILLFLSEVIEICIEKNAKLRIIKGTESHDNRQLEIIESLFVNTSCDVKVIHTVESEWLYDDFHVLYIPEEYMENKDEYYKEYFIENEYDMVFGHGLVQEALHMAATQESETTMAKAPIFKSDELLKICKGPIFFSHVHSKITIKKRIHYTNSFSRFCFGEEADKGFYMCFYFCGINEYRLEYKVNKLARRFDTLSVDCASNHPVADQVDSMISLVKTFSEKTDYIRLEVNIPEDHHNPTLLTKSLTEAFSGVKKFKLKINNNSKIKRQEKSIEVINKLREKYDFIFDKSVPIEIKVQKMIKIKKGREIPVERLLDYLYQEIC